MRGIIWFREDLRINDNTALYMASKKCTDGILAIYIIDHFMIKKHHVAPCRIEFILKGLEVLRLDLIKVNIKLLVTEIKKTSEIAKVIYQIMEKSAAKLLFFNKQYEVNEEKRDRFVMTFLNSKNISCFSFDDQVILPPGSVLTQKREYFKVFTAFKYTWCKQFLLKPSIKLAKLSKSSFCSIDPPLSYLSKEPEILAQTKKYYATNINDKDWPSGENAAIKRLNRFIKHALFTYDQQRDFPARTATSKLSPYLAAGMISPRECFLMALQANKNEIDSGNKGATSWMNELIWREFYKHILVGFPHVSKNRAFRRETEHLPWKFNKQWYRAWQQGQTGYPIIDAAMRQLNETGWMHNRLRMIVGMFLTKNLFLDWRLGEKYFMNRLIDGDFSANNGGWQWCASTGTDAAPYFRIFNPVTQSERFDSEGKFIRQFCPELREFDNKSIHDPHKRSPELAKKINYPKPLVDLKKSRLETINVFKKINLQK